MNVVVVGAGPVGMLCALAFADRGDTVTVIERDPVSPQSLRPRRGVMQFHDPHFYRPQVREVLSEFAPAVWEAIIAAGGVPTGADLMPAGMSALACRRAIVDTAFHQVLTADPRIVRRTGTVEQVLVQGGRVSGVRVEGAPVTADLVLWCAGRTTTVGDAWRPPVQGGPCGYSYVSRMYRATDGRDRFQDHFPIDHDGPGYMSIVFPQDDATLSALFIRPTTDRGLAKVANDEAFTAAAALIPNMAGYTDRTQFTPISSVRKGGLLTNHYRGQVIDSGPVGLLFVGDAVSTTSPMAGRGTAIGLLQVAKLMELRASHQTDDLARAFDQWCTVNVRPWFEDHVLWDYWKVRRWQGQDVDLRGPLPSDLICQAASEDPEIAATAEAFGRMTALPSALEAVQERARVVLRNGWRPPVVGPSREELVAAMT